MCRFDEDGAIVEISDVLQSIPIERIHDDAAPEPEVETS